MTKNKEAITVILGSHILYLIDSLLDDKNKKKASTIRLKQMIFKAIADKKYTEYSELSNKSWTLTVKEFEDKNMRMAVAQAVESLAFYAEDDMKAMYGNEFITVVDRFVQKNNGTLDRYVIKETNTISKSLISSARKVVFDYMKEK